MPGTTCFTFHPLANTTIHQACLFPASFSKGEAETQMLQGDFPQAPASSCLFAFPSSAQERSSVLSNLRAPMKAALLDLCVQGVPGAFPWKMAGVVTWGCSSPRKLTSEWNNARTALGKLVMGMDASCRGPAPWSCREMPTWCWRVTHISVFFYSGGQMAADPTPGGGAPSLCPEATAICLPALESSGECVCWGGWQPLWGMSSAALHTTETEEMKGSRLHLAIGAMFLLKHPWRHHYICSH